MSGALPCQVVAVGNSGDESASFALSFKKPHAVAFATTNVAPFTSDLIKVSGFPAGDTVVAVECDSTVNPAATTSTDCDASSAASGTASAKGKVTFSPDGVTILSGDLYTEAGNNEVLAGGTAAIVVEDETSGISLEIPISLAS